MRVDEDSSRVGQNSSAKRRKAALLFAGMMLAPTMGWAAPVPIVQPAYYEISYEGRISHVFGTFHIGFELADFPARISQDLKTSRVVFVEKIFPRQNVLRELKDGLKERVRTYSLRNRESGETHSPLSAAEIDRVVALGTPREFARLLRCQDLDYFIPYGRYVFPTEKALDFEILKVAVENHRGLRELDHPGLREKADENLQAGGASTECALKTWLNEISVPDELAEQQKLFLRYSSDLDLGETDASYQFRNHHWASDPALFHALKTGGAFISVGAQHLHGPENLLMLLQRQGFRIRRFDGRRRQD